MPPPDASTATPLWRNRDFNRLWASQTLSDLGAQATELALPLLVLGIGGSATAAGAVATTAAASRAVSRLPGGALADRLSRRRLMLASDAVRLVVGATVVTAVVTGHVSVLFLAVAFAVTAAADVVFSPAETGAIAAVVPAEQLPAAFARNEARANAAALAGPPVGGALFGLARAAPFAFDAATYVVSFLAVTAIRRPLHPRTDDAAAAPATEGLAAAIRTGLVHVAGSRFLRALLAVSAPVNFAVTGALFTVTVALRQHGTPAGQIGVALGVVSLGALAGAVAAPALQRRFSLPVLVAGVLWALVVALAAAGLLAPHLAMVVPLTVGLFLAPAVNSLLFARLAATTPTHLQGRVVSIVMLAATGSAALAPLVSGVVLGSAGALAALLLAAAVAVVSAVTATVSRDLRRPD